jgi:hypothetical protein
MYDQETDPYGDYYIYIFNTRSIALQYYGIKLYSVKICLEYLYNGISNN